jgi:hypothetical protein
MLQSIIGAFLSYGLLILMVNEINRMLNEWVSIQLFMGELLPVWLAIVSITIGFIGSIKAVSKFL